MKNELAEIRILSEEKECTFLQAAGIIVAKYKKIWKQDTIELKEPLER